jgi:hypothetical protein
MISVARQIPVSDTADTTLDGSGNGTAKLGPAGAGESWLPSNVSVLCSSNVNEATCKVYAGPTATNPYFKDLTVDGSTGDSTDRCNVPILKGSYVWAVWSGGDAGATGTLNVDYVKTVP